MVASNHEVLFDQVNGILWIKESWIQSTPELRNEHYQCCQSESFNFVFSYKMHDHVNGGFGNEAHQLYCGHCLRKIGGVMAHKIIEQHLGDFVMPFGKYKGAPLEELPRDYLRWCAENLNGNIRKRVRLYLGMAAADK